MRLFNPGDKKERTLLYVVLQGRRLPASVMLMDYCAVTMGLSRSIVSTVSLCLLLLRVTFALDF
jgi:hypothetical protein